MVLLCRLDVIAVRMMHRISSRAKRRSFGLAWALRMTWFVTKLCFTISFEKKIALVFFNFESSQVYDSLIQIMFVYWKNHPWVSKTSRIFRNSCFCRKCKIDVRKVESVIFFELAGHFYNCCVSESGLVLRKTKNRFSACVAMLFDRLVSGWRLQACSEQNKKMDQ